MGDARKIFLVVGVCLTLQEVRSEIIDLGPVGSSHLNHSETPNRPIAPPNLNLIPGALQKCLACHINQQISTNLKTLEGLYAAVPQMPLPLFENMIRRTQQKYPMTPEEIQALTTLHRGQNGGTIPQANWAATPRVDLMGATTSHFLHSLMPSGDSNTAEGQWLNRLRNSGITFFTGNEMPRLYQLPGLNGGQTRVQAAHQLINRNDRERRLGYQDHAAADPNWRDPAGTTGSANVATFKGFLPPAQGPMAYVCARQRGQSGSKQFYGNSVNLTGTVIDTKIAEGTTFFEDIGTNYGGEFFTQELRTRTKTATGWEFGVWRVACTPDELAQIIQEEAPNWNSDPQTNNFVQVLRTRSNVSIRTPQQYLGNAYYLNNTMAKAYQPAAIQDFPDINPQLVAKILRTRPFKNCMGIPWIDGNPPGWAGSTQSTSLNFVPNRFFGGMVPLTNSGCMNCHQDAGKHVDNFDPIVNLGHDRGDLPRNRTWYERVHGMGDLMAFHILDRSSVNGPPRINQQLLQAGLISTQPHPNCH